MGTAGSGCLICDIGDHSVSHYGKEDAELKSYEFKLRYLILLIDSLRVVWHQMPRTFSFIVMRKNDQKINRIFLRLIF